MFDELPVSERFLSGADKYAAYLETPEGRLRSDLTLANVQEFLPVAHDRDRRCLHILDLGCGTGRQAVCLASLGFQLTVIDSSPTMLDMARRAAQAAAVAQRITFEHGDIAQVADFFAPRSFDTVLCHNVLEYVADPLAVLVAAASLIKEDLAVLSILVRSQAGEVLKSALQIGDLDAAERSLTAESGCESLFDGPVRLFTSSFLQDMFQRASLRVIVERGVRVISDYLPPQIGPLAEYARVFALERQLGRRAEFIGIARHKHFILHRARPVEDCP